ncbi:unnamed protein product, partial [Symbiodinium sp. CCMP2456]
MKARREAKRLRMKFNRSLESPNCPDVVLKKAADGKYGTAVLKELFQIYKDSGYDWLNSELVIQAKRLQQTAVTGARAYASFKSLVQKHGEDKAKQLRNEKYALQRLGNYMPDVPWHMSHPDFARDEEEELFLVFDSAKVENSKTDQQSHSFKADMQLSGPQTSMILPALMEQMPKALELGTPCSSGLPGHNPSGQENNDPNRKKPKPKPNGAGKKTVPAAQMAHAKMKDAKALLTDAKMWIHKVDEERKKVPEEATVSPEMCTGYRHQIDFLVANLTEKIAALESKVVCGTTDEQVIKPKMEEVAKAMEKYQKGMTSI